ncbi:hypothetical protein WIW50_13430 [Flavobacteriaceae bacterium 3-367]|uniref:hypothetical protein n=1 Tax=Eudoraea algarum TaxID=3417568 RepID=UPI003287AEA8
MKKLKKMSLAASFCAAIFLIACSSDSSDDTTDDQVGSSNPFTASLGLSPSSVEEGGTATVTLRLDRPNDTGGVLTANFSFGGTVDPMMDVVSMVNASISILNGATEATFDITTLDDDVAEGDETLNVEFSSLPNGVEAGNNASVTLTVTDND